MGIFGEGEAKLLNLDDVPSIGLGTHRALSAELGQSQHLEPTDCCYYDRKGQG